MKETDFLILESLIKSAHTANESIEHIRRTDFENDIYRMSTHFYTHLNKRFAPLNRKGFIELVGYKSGPKGRDEKVWQLTAKAYAVINTKNRINKINVDFKLSA